MNSLNKFLKRYYQLIGVIIMGFVSLNIGATETVNFPNFSIKIVKPPHGGGGHSHIYEINTRYNLYNLSKNDIEGYKEKISGRDYTYQSIREDITKALVCIISSRDLFLVAFYIIFT